MDTRAHGTYARAQDSAGVGVSPLASLPDPQSPREGTAGARLTNVLASRL